MNKSRWLVMLAVVTLAALAFPAPVAAADAITGSVVQQTQAAVFSEVPDPDNPGEWISVLVSPPQYAPLQATVLAYAAKTAGGPGKVVASAPTQADGTFSLPGLTSPVIIQVVPASTDWQGGWLWTEYMDHEPGWASYVQRTPPAAADVQPTDDLGMIQLLSAVASGRVVDPTGTPIAGATVRYDPADASAAPYTTTTGVDGWYSLTGLDFDEYSVKVSARRYVGGYVGYQGVLFGSHADAANWGTGPIWTDPDGDPATEPNHDIVMQPRR